MSDNFKSFTELAKYFDEPIKKLKDSRKDILREIWKYLQGKIKEHYWTYWVGWEKSTTSPTTPLLKTWALKNSVNYWSNQSDLVTITSDKEWLALIHEYWVTYKMTEKQRKYLFSVVFKDQLKWKPKSSWGWGMITIPARPIWRVVWEREEDNVWKLADSMIGIF